MEKFFFCLDFMNKIKTKEELINKIREIGSNKSTNRYLNPLQTLIEELSIDIIKIIFFMLEMIQIPHIMLGIIENKQDETSSIIENRTYEKLSRSFKITIQESEEIFKNPENRKILLNMIEIEKKINIHLFFYFVVILIGFLNKEFLIAKLNQMVSVMGLNPSLAIVFLIIVGFGGNIILSWRRLKSLKRLIFEITSETLSSKESA